MMASWISPISEKLLIDRSELNPLGVSITTVQLALLGASQSIGSFIGPLLLSKLFDIFGRKKCLTVLYFIVTISIVTLAYSTDLIIYYASLFICGVCVGGVNVGQPVYISEICEDHNRGKMSCLGFVGYPLGTVICFLIGPYLSFKYFTVLCALPIAINALCFLTIVPESPIFSVKVHDIRGAKQILRKLRDKSCKEIELEIDKIQYELQETTNSKGGCSQILTDRSSRNGLIIALGSYNLFNISGMAALTAYLQPVFNKVETSISSNICAVFVSTVQILCYIAAASGVERWGRRNILLFSVSASIIPLFIIGLYFHLKLKGYAIVESCNWIPVAGIGIFTVVNGFGTASVPVVIMNEFFTNQVKATATSIIVLVSGVVTALNLFGFPIIMESVGLGWCFWIFTSNCIVGSIFVYFFLPETKGKNLLEIQQILKQLIQKS